MPDLIKMQIKNCLKRSFFIVLILLFSLLQGCTESDANFRNFLYSLSEVDEEERQEKMDAWISGVSEFPLLEDTTVIFIYQNRKEVPIFLTGDMNYWGKDTLPFFNIIGTDYYYCEYSLPEDARVEYKFNVNGNYVNDPLNNRRAAGAFGENSLLLMPAYEYPSETLIKRTVVYTKADTLNFKSNILKNERRVFFYRNADSDNKAPLIIFNDGSDYLLYGQATTILDNLISSEKIPACNAVFVDPVNRMKEYWMSDAYVEMLFTELLSFIKEKYQADPQEIYMGGASLGGLISFYALKSYASRLDGVFSQSGSFWVDSLRIIDELQNADFSTVKIYYDYGSLESKGSAHSELNDFLHEKSARFSWEKVNEGHSWGNWKGHLDNALIYIMNERNKVYNVNK